MLSTRLVDAVLHPVRDHLAFESCVEQLGSAIQLGIFETGTLLPPERVLGEKLGVSRATVREAISALRTAGFVSTTRGRGGGTVVEEFRPTRLPDQAEVGDHPNEINGILIFRRIIEPGACFLAASHSLVPDGESLLFDCLKDLDSASDPSEYRRADARLHLSIASVCGSNDLTKASSMIQTKVHQFLEEIPFLQKNITNSDRQHQQIVKSILEGNPEKARSVMEDHCDATAALLKGLLK